MADLEKNPSLKDGFFENENRWNNSFNYWEKFSLKKIFFEIKNFFFKPFSAKEKIFLSQKKIFDYFRFPPSQEWEGWLDIFFKSKKIFIPWIKIWNFKDLKFWKEIVFEDFDDWKLVREIWFKNHLWILDKKNFPPIFICDNHNHVLESWKFFKWERTQLIHIDQHPDFTDYKKPVKNFRRDLRICDYIKFAIDEKWINKNFISLCENIDFNKYFEENYFNNWKKFSDSEKIFSQFEKKFLKKNWEEKIILNIDLDIFVDRQTMVNHEKIFEFIKFLKWKVDLISIASSPLFLEKEKVLPLIKKILKYT